MSSDLAPKESPLHEAPFDPGFPIVAMAASAGGLRAYSEVLAALPKEFPAAIVAVQHLDARHPSLMAQILARRTPLRVKQAATGDRLHPGCVYIAPSDQHLLIGERGEISLSHADPVRFLRPSADLLFESVARCFGKRAIAVVLTGTGTDGARGVKSIKQAGGRVIVEDASTAEFNGMPGAAVATGSADLTLPLARIGPALVRLVTTGAIG